MSFSFDVLMRDEIALTFGPGRNRRLIFTTARSEYALKAFRYSAIDSLMKPIETDQLIAAVSKALLRMKNQQSSSEQIDFLKESSVF